MNLSDLKVEDLHNPAIVKAYSLYMDISFIITTTCYILMLYIITTKSSKSIKTYKYLIVNQITWSYFVEFTFSFWQPIALLPYFIWYSAGPAQYFGRAIVYFMSYVFVLAATGFAHSIFFSLFFRLVMVKAKSRFHKLFNTKKWLMLMHFSTLLPVLMLPQVPLVFIFLHQRSYEEIMQASILETPIMQYFFENYTIAGIHPHSSRDIWIYFLFIGISIAFTILLILFIAIPTRFVVLMRRNKTFMTPKTYKLNLKLFQILMVQTLLAVILLLLPAILSIILVQARVSGGSVYLTLLSAMPSLHFIGDLLSLLYIKDYRRFFYGKLQTISSMVFKFLGIHQENNNAVQPMTEPTIPLSTIKVRQQNMRKFSNVVLPANNSGWN